MCYYTNLNCLKLTDITFNQLIGVVGKVSTNDVWDLGSIPGRVIPKTLKWYLIPPFLTLSNIRYVSRVKQSNPGKGVAPSPTPRRWSCWKVNLLITLDYGRQLLHLTACLNWALSLNWIAWDQNCEEKNQNDINLAVNDPKRVDTL